MKTISFKVSEDEARFIQRKAKSEKLSVSDYLRSRAIRGSTGPQKPKLVRCPKTGAMIFAPLQGGLPLSTESVRELLSDFP